MNKLTDSAWNRKRLLKALMDTLDDACQFLMQLSPELYSSPLPVLSGSSLGQHTRHMLEFLDCLIRQAPAGTLNYDLRCRRSDWESDPEAANHGIHDILYKLENLVFPEDIFLESEYDPAANSPILVPTTFSRELVYNIEHVIHHLALIRVGLNVAAPEIALPATFGWAPSTLRHREKTHG